MTTRILIFIALTLSFLAIQACESAGSSGKIVYGIDTSNYGQNGVIVHKLGQKETYLEQWPKTHHTPGLQGITVVRRLYPRIPTKYRDPTSAFGRFPGYPNSLPEQIEVKWQLAELSDCKDQGPAMSDKSKIWMTSNGYDPKYHILARGCTWTPLPDKIFTQKVDMAKLKAGEAYQRTGTRAEGSGGRYTLNLSFIFMEDELKVEAKNGVTNKWR